MRLREVYYAILKSEAGLVATQAFGVGNAVSRWIADISTNLNARISVDDLVAGRYEPGRVSSKIQARLWAISSQME